MVSAQKRQRADGVVSDKNSDATSTSPVSSSMTTTTSEITRSETVLGGWAASRRLVTTPVDLDDSMPLNTTNHADLGSVSTDSTFPNHSPTGASNSAKNVSTSAGRREPPNCCAASFVAIAVMADRRRIGETDLGKGRALIAPLA